jgi:hypothetical protein
MREVSVEALKYNPRSQIIKMRKESMSQVELCMLGVEKRNSMSKMHIRSMKASDKRMQPVNSKAT